MDTTTASQPGPSDLAYLEEYADTVVSLPHEIQRNFTLIREHDSKVQSLNESLYASLDEFLDDSTPSTQKPSLLTALKTGFLSTLSHAEEKVSLAAQCYNAVEKHLCKLEDDLKCFEEEIRLAGYEEILRNARESKKKTSSQASAASVTPSANSNKKRSRPQATAEATAKRTRRNSLATTTANAAASDEDSQGPEQQQQQLSRAERLLRRTKPALQADESVEKSNEGDDESEPVESKEEAVEEEVGVGKGVEEESESKVKPKESKEAKDSSEEAEEAEESAEPVTSQQSLPQQPQQRTTRSRSNSTSSASTKEPLYCTCKRVSFGQMVACDNKDCPVEWFHYQCVGLKNPPKGKWYCSKECQQKKRK